MYPQSAQNFANSIVTRLERNPWIKKCLKIAASGVSLLALRIMYKKIKSVVKKSPPQLYGLPFIGSLFTMLFWQQKFHLKLLPHYGDLVTFNIINLQFVTINECQLAHKICKIANTRPDFTYIGFKIGNRCPVFALGNDKWLHRRKKYMEYLTRILSSTQVEDKICSVLQNITYNYLDSHLIDNNKYLWYPRECVGNVTFNVMYLAMFNKTLDIDSPLFKNYHWCVSHFLSDVFPTAFDYYIPDIISNPIFGHYRKSFLKALNFMYENIGKEYKEMEVTLAIHDDTDDNNNNSDNCENSSTLAECYMQDNKNFKEKERKLSLDDEYIIADLVSLMLGGTDTSSHVSETGIILLSKYPQIENAIYNVC